MRSGTAHVPRPMSVYLKEARATAALALPIIVGQVSQMLLYH